ncbi:DnaB-like replicative DNA helicase (plasmid) [Candidatus Trichorickettsia mobilis]|uniref:DNA 5'-3' helicase n=1 Tax=Candidatus Trichorickettsia mobilis TaxID=1346319 RepID=A0ABZ0UTY2_9RICK|nr:DnaB-like helicase C-terminal domain-containing protein [Candidatus Trichorickettsia mobilis]WPY01503.1 DnaB-like replicative DNA helicase [Candidatus Trichorickettsia mobilis]
MSNTENQQELYNLDLEQWLIGCMISPLTGYPGIISKVSSVLEENDFYHPCNGFLFKRLKEIDKATNDVYLYHLMLLNTDKDQWKAVSDIDIKSYLASARTNAAPITNSTSIITKVKELSIKRQMLDSLSKSVTKVKDPSTVAETVASDTISSIENLFNDNIATNEYIYDILDNFLNNDDEIQPISSGHSHIDYLLEGGFRNGQLIVLAGRTSMGKSAFAVNLALNACSQNKKVMFFSFEMPRKQVLCRILSNRLGFNSKKLKHKDNKHNLQEQHNAIKRYQIQEKDQIFISDEEVTSLSAFKNKCQTLKNQVGLDIVFIDYLQMISLKSESNNKQYQNKVYQIEEITRALKQIAIELEVPIVVLSQLSRGAEKREDRRPLMSDLRDSGAIEQDADTVMLLYREEYYLKQAEPAVYEKDKHADWAKKMDDARNVVEVIIAKNREGETGKVQLHADLGANKFTDLAQENSWN